MTKLRITNLFYLERVPRSPHDYLTSCFCFKDLPFTLSGFLIKVCKKKNFSISKCLILTFFTDFEETFVSKRGMLFRFPKNLVYTESFIPFERKYYFSDYRNFPFCNKFYKVKTQFPFCINDSKNKNKKFDFSRFLMKGEHDEHDLLNLIT